MLKKLFSKIEKANVLLSKDVGFLMGSNDVEFIYI